MVSSEVQRTLVKSPPELWAELSDPAALSRHLGELGEIRIVRTEPEHAVEWQAGDTTGTVSIKPSAWGTKVTITASRELSPPEPAGEEASPPGDAEVTAGTEGAPDPVGVDTEATTDVDAPELADPAEATTPELSAPTEATTTPELTDAPESDEAPEADGSNGDASDEELAGQPGGHSRRGFLAWLFGARRPRRGLAPEAAVAGAPVAGHPPPDSPTGRSEVLEAVGEALRVERVMLVDAFSIPARAQGWEPDPDREHGIQSLRDVAAELRAAEEIAAAEVTAVLTSVLDRLGAAHHRPFSRA